MFNYIKGVVTDVTGNYVVLENNNIGYEINVGNPYSFEVGNTYTIYTYNKVGEDENSLYGFKTKDEKELFLKLISVKGVGPKMALPMLATGSISGIMDAIERENILYLKKFPKIGDKVAKQMCLDLKGKFGKVEGVESGNLEELVEVLESLGYKSGDIKRVLPQINPSDKVEVQVKEALRLMLK